LKTRFNRRWHLSSPFSNSESWMKLVVPRPGSFSFSCVQCFGEWIWLDEVSVFGGCVGRGGRLVRFNLSTHTSSLFHDLHSFLWKIVALLYNPLGPPSPTSLAPHQLFPQNSLLEKRLWRGGVNGPAIWCSNEVGPPQIFYGPRCNDKMWVRITNLPIPQWKNKLKTKKNPISGFFMVENMCTQFNTKIKVPPPKP
jgi:hypothetical protein